MANLSELSDEKFDLLIKKTLAEKTQALLKGQLTKCDCLDNEELASCVDYSLNKLTLKQKRNYEQKQERINEHLKTCDYHGSFFFLLVSLRGSEKKYEIN